jgi:hypothetical protein
VVALVALVLYGRSGVVRGLRHTRYGRVIGPWVSAARRPAAATKSPSKPKRMRWGDRWFWLLAATAVTAVAAWVVTRVLIASPGLSH